MDRLTQQYLDSLKSAIRPGTRGAPERRATHQHIAAHHTAHQRNLTEWPRKNGSHYCRELSPEKLALRMAAHGLTADQWAYDRATRQTDERRTSARHTRLMQPIQAAILDAPVSSLVAYYQAHSGQGCTSPIYDEVLRCHLGTPDLWRYVSAYIRSEAAIDADDSVICYAESTKWERVGKRSYPRVCNRRINRFTRTGCETIRMLDTGERAEAAIDAMIPGRAEHRTAMAAAEKIKIIDCYKRVAVAETGKMISIFDGQTEYAIGQIAHDPIAIRENICTGGGIFVHETAERAVAQEYSSESKAALHPRVTLRGYAWGRKKINGKIAAEYFCPVAVCA